jgi:sugar phosphate isomerase/epimerase
MALSAGKPLGRPWICIFSKHMAQLDWDQLGREAKRIGFDGVDLTVRPQGHVEPQRVKEDLPAAVAAIRAHQLQVPMITTGVTTASDRAADPTLATAGELGIPFWKPGYVRYNLDDVEASLTRARQGYASLVALGKRYRIAAGFHNHSGDYVGAAVWDLRSLLEDLDPQWAGYYFDPGHATIEGGLAGWRIAQTIVSQRLKMVAVKDFYWTRTARGWKPEWCPLGEGMVDWDKVFANLARTGFRGPISLHIEYETKNELDAIARDFAFLRRQVEKAYGGSQG